MKQSDRLRAGNAAELVTSPSGKEEDMKKYPFSIAKHGHDIEFRYNRLKNMEADYFGGEIKLNNEEFEKLEKELEIVREAYETILNTFSDGRVVWVDGKTYGKLMECVAWATTERDMRNRRI